MNIKPNTAQRPPSDQRIQWFEKSYRVKLPEEYLQFLSIGNGGVPVQNIFNTAKGNERLIENFLCILDNPKEEPVVGWQDITVVMSQLDERLIDDEDLIGMNIIPFAALFGGDFVCLDYRNPVDPPQVVVWHHEQSDEFSPHTEPVAESFTEFMTLLKS